MVTQKRWLVTRKAHGKKASEEAEKKKKAKDD
jgi:hypothetical protein